MTENVYFKIAVVIFCFLALHLLLPSGESADVLSALLGAFTRIVIAYGTGVCLARAIFEAQL